MHSVYILYSRSYNRYYIGHTENIEKRLALHNSGAVKSTKSYGPWTVVNTELFSTKQGAFKREWQIKSYKSGEAFKKLLK